MNWFKIKCKSRKTNEHTIAIVLGDNKKEARQNFDKFWDIDNKFICFIKD